MRRSRTKYLVFMMMILLCFGITWNSVPVSAADIVTLKVIGDDERGVMLEEIKIPYEVGSTALSVLLKAYSDSEGKLIKGKVIVRGGLAHGFVEEIDGLSEGKRGPVSGWVYEVNDIRPEVDAGSTKLKPGDKVIWEYTNGYY